jgi:hypothetical protein
MQVAARRSVVGWVLVALALAGGSATSSACFPRVCEDIAEGDCKREHGTYDNETCTCSGAYEEPSPSSSSSSPPPCACDTDCGLGRCLSTGECTSAECITDLDCRAEARCDGRIGGTCVASCQNDNDCPSSFACVEGFCGTRPNHEDGGTCPDGDLRSSDGWCGARCVGRLANNEPCFSPNHCDDLGMCAHTGLTRCERDSDCRESAGATCEEGRCSKSSSRGDAGYADAGADGG